MLYVLKYDPPNDELVHWGIKDMRWGVRRYQNSDGSLTPAGRARYSSAKKKEMDAALDKAYSEAVDRHLRRHPGDVSGAKAAGRTASKAATATTRIDRAALEKKTIDEAVKKDLDDTNTVLRETTNATRTSANAVKNVRVNVPRLDLSSMSDQELRSRIQREQLESQYDQMFNTRRHSVENGKAAVASVLETVGTVASVTGSALAIAIAIKDLAARGS